LSIVVDKEIIMDLKELDIDKKIHLSINLLTNAINNKDKEESEIWKAYSWLEYTILLVRLKKYNLLDEGEQKRLKNNKKQVVPDVLLRNARDLLLNLNYMDDDQLLNSLRASRDLLRIFLKTKK
ncbi:MAG: hypothetical protein QOK67_04180, partial [Nitrososphaeraceae archaeon]|nr:hypothetical protein [Nitrososphaeraceae archaeon]